MVGPQVVHEGPDLDAGAGEDALGVYALWVPGDSSSIKLPPSGSVLCALSYRYSRVLFSPLTNAGKTSSAFVVVLAVRKRSLGVRIAP